MTIDDKLAQWDAGERILVGVQALLDAPGACELAGLIGFDTVWLEMEHGPSGFEKLRTLSVFAQTGGAIPVARIPDHGRHHILRNVESGIPIILIPMVNNADIARQIVEHGKFSPEGARGFNTGSRGLGYGLSETLEAFAAANRRTHLIAQIETREGLDNLDEILAVDGLAGIFVGPGDLSVALGLPAQLTHPEMLETVASTIGRARAAGKHAGLLGPPQLLQAGLAAGADFFFCGNDITALRTTWVELLERAKQGFVE